MDWFLKKIQSGRKRCYSSVRGEEIYSTYMQFGFMMAGSDAKLKTWHLWHMTYIYIHIYISHIVFVIYFGIWFLENLNYHKWAWSYSTTVGSQVQRTTPALFKDEKDMTLWIHCNPFQVQHCPTIIKGFVTLQLKIWFLLTTDRLLPILKWCTGILQGVSVVYDRTDKCSYRCGREHLKTPPTPKINFQVKIEVIIIAE